MRLLARLSCQAVALLMAGSAVATTVVTADTSPGTPRDQNGVAHEALDDVLWRAIEKPEAVSAEALVENGGASREPKKVDRQEKVARDGMFLLFLQILRSPK